MTNRFSPSATASGEAPRRAAPTSSGCAVYRLMESAALGVAQAAARLEYLTFPSLRQRAQTQRLNEPLYAVTVTCGGEPVGLALAHGAPEHSVAEIISLYVRRDHRGCGLSKPLLAGLERLLARHGYPRAQLAYRSDWPARAIIERRLQQLGWTTPHTHLTLGKFSVPQASAAWQQGVICNYRLPAGFEIGPWNTVSTQELAALAHDGDADYPEELAPLEEPALIEPLTSLVLRHRDRIIGWIMTHRLDAKTLQYTRLHVEPPYQRLGRGLPLLGAAIQRQIDAEIPFGVFQVRADNPRMQRLITRRLQPYLVTWTDSRRSEKRLAPMNAPGVGPALVRRPGLP